MPSVTYDEMRSNAERIADEEIKERVLRGIEVLNAWDPDWPDYIDPSELLLESPSQCVLGQLFDRHKLNDEQRTRLEQHYRGTNVPDVAIPGYFKGVVILNGEVEDAPAQFGFECAEESYSMLTEAWLLALGADDVLEGDEAGEDD